MYTEELLDSDVVSLGGGSGSSMPAQRKLKAAPPADSRPRGLDLQAIELYYLGAVEADAGVTESP